jgi:FkbM family methyltransferase
LWLCYLNDIIINDYNNKIQNKIEVPQKSKFCSIICQQDNVSNTRSEIVNKLSKYKRVDCGGKFMNNIGYVVPRGINCSGKIEHNNNYKFAITFENKEYPGYVTEKMCDAYKSKCIPIYWGTSDVVKDFNKSTFINANDFVSIDELVEYIIKVDNNDELYASYFKEPILSNKWLDILNDPYKTFYKNLAHTIIGKNNNLSPNFKIEYGIEQNKIDITQKTIDLSLNKELIEIPANDEIRATLYGDPCWGVVKYIYIYTTDGTHLKFSQEHNVELDFNGFLITKILRPESLTVYKSPYNKIRLGKDYDGGYIICDIPDIKYDFFLSGGILDDISFEEDFCSKYPDVKCLAHDGFIDNIDIKNNNITFIKQYIGDSNNEYFTNLHSIINQYNNIFIKMDIEGGEIAWINSLSTDQIDKFAQIVIEFHFPFYEKECLVFEKLLKSHILVHFHANNCCGTNTIKNIEIPNVFECTYIHKKYYTTDLELNTSTIPGTLDMKNVIDKDEICIDYQPFVHPASDTYNFKIEYGINDNKINITYSQASQDIFVTNVLKHKKNGYFVEIGTNDPIEGNNTYILENNYEFKGLLVEYESFYENSYKQHRPNSIYIIDDARNINYKKVLDDNKFPKNIDYLQIDLDVDNKSTLDTLILLDNTVFDTYKFATITFEHDIYRGNYFNTREISREIFKKRGYLLVFPDICTDQGCIGTGWQPFEDWYVHPDLVDMNFINIIKTDKSLRNDHIKNIIINTSKKYNKSEKMKVIFSNNCSVGDIYFSQPFIKNIVENNPDNDYYIYHQTSSYYFTDILKIKDVNKIPELKEKLYQVFNFKINLYDLVNIQNMSSYVYRYDKTNNILLICTWLGCIRNKYPMLECNMISYNNAYKLFINDINKDLNFDLKYNDELSLDVYPSVPILDIKKYREFKDKNFNKSIIFYYNFLPSSGQSYPVKNYDEHNEIIKNLSENNIVVVPHKQSYKGNTENVYFADDFLENVEYYDAKNFYYHAQMAYESDYSIYFDLGRSFMSMNKTFIEDNNNNIRIHITNNEYFYNSLNNNLLVSKNYMNLIKVNNYIDIINELNKVIKYNKFHGEIHNNQNVDEILRSYFPDYKYKGVFFEIGAYHPIEISNSYHFEKNGWDCYCFEANPNLIPELKKYRKNVFNYAISNENKDDINFQICLQDMKTCSFSAIEISEDYKNHFFYDPTEIINVTVNQRTINSIIENEIQNLDKIDIVSLDIEGGELNCLYGFDLEKYKPKVLIIEDAFNNTILDEYMFKFGYKLDKHISYNKYYVYDK